ncbi:MAG: threonine/serine dehydratase [Pseudomonadota bacterium]
MVVISKLPTSRDVEAADERLAPYVVRTPMVRHDELDAKTKARVFVKLEPLQRTGSFKFRGAFNRLSQLNAHERETGVVAFSSGNHAQGVAEAARLLNIPATIVMPADAPTIKLRNTEKLGAEVITYDRETESRELIAEELAEKRGAILVPSFDDPHIVAGQGTMGLEMVRFAKAHGLTPDLAVICCGGGGLTSGSTLALKDSFPEIDIMTAEPEGYDDTMRSLELGTRVGVDGHPPSICDALMSPHCGKIPFEIMRANAVHGVAVSDVQVRKAMAFAFYRLHVVAEPGGAVALAALLSGALNLEGKTVFAVISGGNVDLKLFTESIAAFEKA